ncbi:hypothetical protein J4E90_007808 [Alternaria incomplexa]|uniref:uncharacterized protein n=1 Tax=Alternaria incomplexa TaxID=1187928 RepID=UPI00221F5C46|nr:uncharacterized protein J4E90_007808 [Alternaria incomplexa]KAI4910373.1 hypothetical protein J4E90_007808 [Alternaria incomplexa]
MSEGAYKRRNRADSGTFTCDSETESFCEAMLRLADYLIEEDPKLDKPDQVRTGGCILFVRDDLQEDMRVMKVLPSEAMYPGFQAREMNILSRLHHRNIISLHDAHLPSPVTERHASPYIVTEYCDHGTLADLIKRWNEHGELLPESFVWQVFEALVAAVQYLHHGPYSYNEAAYNWDPITHRDIIPSNIFLKSDTQVIPSDYPISIKLADLGCAITNSEMEAYNYTLRDLPLVADQYRPPEGAQATEATDMYQVGLVMSLMYCMTDSPSSNIAETGNLTQDYLAGYKGYSSELRMFIEMCLDVDDEQRPHTNFFLLRIQSARRFLSNAGKFGAQVDLFAQG